MKKKLVEWVKRYLPAEIVSIILTLISSVLAYKFTSSHLTTALIGTWVGNIGYFGTILLTDIFQTNRALAYKNMPYTYKILIQNIRALIVEFGLAEVFDSLFVRPMLMYHFPIWLGNISIGILLAKFTADITFYIPAIVAYELSKKKFRKFE